MFIVGQEYDRNELLKFVGSSQAQSGIIWGPKDPTCVIVASGGKHGKSAGYGDKKNPDGSIFYIGQGEKGDQSPTKYSNSLLVNGERSVLFFSTREPNSKEIRQRGSHKKLYQFEGLFEVASWEFITPTEGKRRGDKLLQFLLMPANNIFANRIIEVGDSLRTQDQSFDDLRKKIYSQSKKPIKGMTTYREYFHRCQNIVTYTKMRANGNCELCDEVAPFVDLNDIPFLEVHHIKRLADDGPDGCENVAAICPNCHREAHFGKDRDIIRDQLSKKILEKEKHLNLFTVST